MEDKFLWVERYRPTTVDECILPARLKASLKAYVADGKIPNLLFEGPPGTGKTTAARALCEEVGLDYIVVNSSEERGIDTLRTKIVDYASTVSLTGKGKCIIMDEADFLTPEAQGAFRGIIERFSDHCRFILTCNFAAKLMDAIISRMATFSFRFEKNEILPSKAAFFNRVETILKKENVEYEPKAVVKLVEKHFPDFRKTLGELQRLSISGKVDTFNALATIDGLIIAIKEKDFSKARKWLAENNDLNSTDIFRKLYDGLYDVFKPESIPVAITIIGEYSYRHAFVADPEINLAACVIELMAKTELKG